MVTLRLERRTRSNYDTTSVSVRRSPTMSKKIPRFTFLISVLLHLGHIQLTSSATIEILGASHYEVEGSRGFGDDALCDSNYGTYQVPKHMPHCARIQGTIDGLGIEMVGIPKQCSRDRPSDAAFNGGKCAFKTDTAKCNEVEAERILVDGEYIVPDCGSYLMSVDGVPIPCGPDVEINRVIVPSPCKINQAEPLMIGNYTLEYCSQTTCTTDADGVKLCKCTSQDTCKWLKASESANTKCTRTIVVSDRVAPVVTLVGPALVEGFEAGRGNFFIDPGATAYDGVDGVMFYYESNCSILRTKAECNAFVGKANISECDWRENITDVITERDTGDQYCTASPCNVEIEDGKVVLKKFGNPGSICRIVTGADGGFTYSRRLIGNQTFTYFAVDTSGNIQNVRRIVNVVDTIPPDLDINPKIVVSEAGDLYFDHVPEAYDTVDLNITYVGQNDSKGFPTKGPMIPLAPASLDIPGNCERQKKFPDFWSEEPRYSGQCLVTVRAHSMVNEFPSYELDPTARALPMLQSILYRVTDRSFNQRPNASMKVADHRRVVRVVDTTKPNLTLINDSEIFHEGGDVYYEPWATAKDTLDGVITDKINLRVERKSHLDCTKRKGCNFQPQVCEFTAPLYVREEHCDSKRVAVFAPANTKFELSYSVIDRSGNVGQATRNVTIIDTRIPVIHLHGVTPMALEGATPYFEPGANATDELDDDHTLSSQIQIVCVNCEDLTTLGVSTNGTNVDSNSPAFTVFQISYNVTDVAGNEAVTLFRDVVVRDSTAPIISFNVGSGGSHLSHEAASAFLALDKINAVDTLDRRRYGNYSFSPRTTSRIRSDVSELTSDCLPTEYLSRPRSSNFIAQCSNISDVCAVDQFEAAPPSSTSDRVCVDLTPRCTLGPEIKTPTPVSDRECYDCPGGVTTRMQPVDTVVAVHAEQKLSIRWGFGAHGQTYVINTGDIVEWSWGESISGYRSVVSGTRNVSDLLFMSTIDTGAASTLTHTFTQVGVYPFFHGAYTDLNAVVVVQDRGKETFEVRVTNTGFEPEEISVLVGDTVTWVLEPDVVSTLSSFDDDGALLWRESARLTGMFSKTMTTAMTMDVTIQSDAVGADIDFFNSEVIVTKPSSPRPSPSLINRPLWNVGLKSVDEDALALCEEVKVSDLTRVLTIKSACKSNFVGGDDAIVIYNVGQVTSETENQREIKALASMIERRVLDDGDVLVMGVAWDATTFLKNQLALARARTSTSTSTSTPITTTATSTARYQIYVQVSDTSAWTRVDATVMTLPTQALVLGPQSKIRIHPGKDFNSTITDAFRYRLWDKAKAAPGSVVDGDAMMVEDAFGRSTEESTSTSPCSSLVSMFVTPLNDAPELVNDFEIEPRGIDEDNNYDFYPPLLLNVVLSGIYVDVDGDYSNGVGVAVLGVSTEFGEWGWTCGQRQIETYTPFPPTIAPSSAMLLDGSCRVRFKPDLHYNTEFDQNYTARDQKNRPSLSLCAWDPTAISTLVAGDTNVSVPEARFRGRHGDAFGSNDVTASVTVFAIDDPPAIINADMSQAVQSDDEPITYETSYHEEAKSIPIVDLKMNISLVYADRVDITQLTLEFINRLDGDDEAVLWSTKLLLELGLVVQQTPNIAELSVLYEFTCETRRRCGVVNFNTLLRSLRYRNKQRNPTVGVREVTMFAQDERLLGDVRTTTIDVVPVNSRPYLDLDSHPDLHGWLDYDVSVGEEVSVAPNANIVDDDSQNLTKLTVFLVDNRQGEYLRYDDSGGTPTGFKHSIKVDGAIEIVGVATSSEWIPVIRNVVYRGTSTTLPADRRVVFTMFDHDGRQSYPSSIFIGLKGKISRPWLDLNGEQSGIDIDSAIEIVYKEDGPPVAFALDNMFIVTPFSQPITQCEISIGRAVDQPFEMIVCDTSLLLRENLQAYYDVGAARMTISGAGTIATYISVLKSCGYQNRANEPQLGSGRVLTFTVSTGSIVGATSATSPTAHISLSIVSTNDAPVIRPLAEPSLMAVKQDVSDTDNGGVSLRELVGEEVNTINGEVAPAIPTFPPFVKVVSCASKGGCAYDEAEERCRRENMVVCTRDDLRRAWPAGRDHTVLAWTADTVVSDPYAGLSRDIQGVELDYGDDNASGYLVAGSNGADVAQFFVGRRQGKEKGVAIDAMCCGVEKVGVEEVESTRRVFVEFTGYGISGGVSFVQHAPHFPTQILVNLRGLQTPTLGGTTATLGDIQIREFTVPSGGVVSERDRCANVGTVFDPNQSNCTNLYTSLCGQGVVDQQLGLCCALNSSSLPVTSCNVSTINISCTSPNQVNCKLPSTRQCATGRVNERFDILEDDAVDLDKVFIDSSITLFGNNSILGRSLVLYDVSGRSLLCNTIGLPDLVEHVTTVLKSDTGEVVAKVSMTRVVDDASVPIQTRVVFEPAFTVRAGHSGAYQLALVDTTDGGGVTCNDVVVASKNTVFSQQITATQGTASASSSNNAPIPIAADVILSTGSSSSSSSASNVYCGAVHRPRAVHAFIEMTGTKGIATFRQDSDADPVTVDLRFITSRRAADKFVLDGANFAIHTLPAVDSGSTGQGRQCGVESVGKMFNANCNTADGSCSPGKILNDVLRFPERELNHRGGGNFDSSFSLQALTLYGMRSISGRSFVIKPDAQDESSWICGTIGYATDVAVAVANFGAPLIEGAQAPLVGSIVFTQSKYDLSDETSVEVRLGYADGAQTTSSYEWSVRTKPATYTCTQAGVLLEDVNNPGLGDLFARHQSLRLPSLTMVKDASLSLGGRLSILGRGIVIYKGGVPFACATIKPLAPRVATASFNSGGTHGTVVMTQSSPTARTRVDVRLNTVGDNTGLYVMDSLPQVDRRDVLAPQWECGSSRSARDTVYNPVNSAGTPMVAQTRQACGTAETRDTCKLGDLLGGMVYAGGVPVYRTMLFTDLPLFGPMRVANRGLAILPSTRNGVPVCAPLTLPIVEVKGEAVFGLPAGDGIYDGAMRGSINFAQRINDAQSEVTIDVKLEHECVRRGYSFELSNDTILDITPTKKGVFGPRVQYPVESIEQCSGLCASFPGCQFWSWASPTANADLETGVFAGDCYLLTIGRASFELKGFVSGAAGCPRQTAVSHKWSIIDGVDGVEHNCVDGTLTMAQGQQMSTYNPQNVPTVSPTQVVSMQSCEVGDLTCKHGEVYVSTPKEGVIYTDTQLPLQGPGSVLGRTVVVEYPGSPRVQCAVVDTRYSQVLEDSDVADSAGLAITNVNEEFGFFQVRDGLDDVWRKLPTSLDRSNALLTSLKQTHDWRLRFVPNPGYQGRVTCLECPEVRSALDCEPCALNRTVATITYAAWDGNQGANGEFANVTFTDNKGSFSATTKTVRVDVVPRSNINVSAPHGSVFAISYDVEDNVGNKATTLVRNVIISDTQGPSLSLRNENVTIVEAATPYVDPGVFAYDRRDGEVTRSVEIVSILGNANIGRAKCVGASLVSDVIAYTSDGLMETFVPNNTVFSITFQVTDAAGNVAQVVREVRVLDTTKPVLSHVSRMVSIQSTRQQTPPPTPQSVSDGVFCPLAREVYLPSQLSELSCVTANDTLDGDVSCTARIKDVQVLPPILIPSEEWSTSGSRLRYSLPYRVNKSCIGRTRQAQNTQQLDCSVAQNGLGIYVIDPSAPVGTRYLVTYVANDAAGNVAEAYVIAIVEDTLPPTLVFSGGDTTVVEYGSTFDEAARLKGVTAFDVGDGDLTSAILPGVEVVNTVVPGEYNVTYSVSDGTRNVVSVIRTVVVQSDAANISRAFCDTGVCACRCAGGIGVGKAKLAITGVAVSDFDTLEVHTAFKTTALVLVQSLFTNATTLEIARLSTFDADASGINTFSVSMIMRADACDVDTALGQLQQATTLSQWKTALLTQNSDVFKADFTLKFDGNTTVDDCSAIEINNALAAQSGDDDDEDQGWIAAVVVPIIVLIVIFVVVYIKVMGKRKKSAVLEQLQESSTIENSAYGATKEETSNINRHRFESTKAAKKSPSALPPTPKNKKINKYFDDDPDAPGLPSKGGNFDEDPDAPHLPSKGRQADDDDVLFPKLPPPKAKGAKIGVDYSMSQEEMYEFGDGASKPGFHTHDKKIQDQRNDDSYLEVHPIDDDDAPQLPSKPSADIVAFSSSDQEVYEMGDAASKPGFKSHDDRRKQMKREKEAAQGPPPPPKTDTARQPAEIHMMESMDEVYEVGADGVRPGFNANSSREEPAPPPPPKKPNQPDIMFESMDEVYEVGADAVRPGFNANSSREVPAPPPPPKKPNQPDIMLESMDEVYEVGADAVRSGFNANSSHNEEKPPVIPQKYTVDAARVMVESADEMYEVGADAVRPGFNAHDRSKRSDALQDIYEATNQGAPPLAAKSSTETDLTCGYFSKSGRRCGQKAKSPSSQCSNHTCTTPGCVQPKSSSATTCSQHESNPAMMISSEPEMYEVGADNIRPGFNTNSNSTQEAPPLPSKPTTDGNVSQCGYFSKEGRRCKQKPSGPSPQCQSHTCSMDDCVGPKSSSAHYCERHEATAPASYETNDRSRDSNEREALYDATS